MPHETNSHSTSGLDQYFQGTYCTHLPGIWTGRSTTQIEPSVCRVEKDFSISSEVSDQLILCAWAKVLTLFTALEDISFGVALISDSAQSSNSVRCFPCRLNVSLEDNPETITQSIQDSLNRGQKHSSDSLTDLRNYIKHGTVVQIVSEDTNNDLKSEDLKIPIRVVFKRSSRDIVIEIHASQELYAQDYLTAILHQTAKSLNWLLGHCALPTDQGSLATILSWTKPCESSPAHQELHQWVKEQANASPNAVAIGESERVMTYRELDHGADLLANHLSSTWSDKKKSRNIGIFFEKSAFAIMSMLAILKTGNTYVPIDIAWPSKRIVAVLDNASIEDVFCSKSQRSHLPQQEYKQIIIVDEWLVHDLEKHTTKPDESHEIQPSTAAYMLYTSGSTGTPKGISVSHRAICTSIQAMARHLGIDNSTRTFQYASFTFDLHVADLWMTLSFGGRICLPSEVERMNPSEFIRQERCNYALITPTAASIIDRSIMHDNFRTLALLGEAVPERLLNDIATSNASMKIYNTWGPTEASVLASSSESIVARDGTLPLHPNNIGQSIGATMLLVNPANPDELADPYTPGEIVLVGNTLADGYHNNIEKTREAFRTDLEWTRNESLVQKIGCADALKVVYLTGDIGRHNPNGDGTIIFMHRKEGGYVKVNGYRVDPGEVESRIMQFAGDEVPIKNACVIAHEQVDDSSDRVKQALICILDTGREKSIPGRSCSLIDLSTQQKKSLNRVVAALRDAMPEYMVPSFFVPVTFSPVTTSYKIDRKAMSTVLKDRSWSELTTRFGV